ncbi:MAG: protein kinase [Gemmatimonadota bacterium]
MTRSQSPAWGETLSFAYLPSLMPSSSQLPRLNQALAGRYRIERELGQGGMATVYLADDGKHQRQVAVKVLRPEIAAALGTDRFLREIQIAAGLSHPNILPLYDSGESEGFLFYVMPYVKGESLRQKLDREGPLPIDEASRIIRQVARALDHAHALGLVHRDIKPENVLLHESEPMLADFGIALLAAPGSGERLTAAGLMVGTPEYMSPEQVAGERVVDGRSDVYSLASMLYELLTGEPPYTGSLQSILVKRFTHPVPGVRRLRPAVPQSIERAIEKALAKIPADRFATAGAFGDALMERDIRQPARDPSVAVLPFLNLSADSENEFFADGITEDVIAQLSKIRSLKVISRTSAMVFKNRDRSLREIGVALGTATVIEGSVRRSGNRVRIVAQLIDTDTGQHLWAETYDRQLTDIFAIQSDVALQIATALEAELSPAERTRIGQEPTRDVVAYQHYLQGRHWLCQYSGVGLAKAVEYFEKALALDPTYARAYCGVSLAYAHQGLGNGDELMNPKAAFELAEEAALRALALDSGLGDAHSVRGLLALVYRFDWAGAERELKTALELNPNDADAYDHYGWLCSGLGRYDEALAMVQRAQELDPLAHRSDLGSTLLRAGRYEEALDAANRSIEFDPDFPRGYSVRGWARLRLGDSTMGIADLTRAAELAAGNTMFLAQLAQAHAIVGNAEKARGIIRDIRDLETWRYVSPYHLAYAYTGLGEDDTAIDLLERAYDERAGALYGVKGSFLFTSLHSHPRFQALLRKLNLA